MRGPLSGQYKIIRSWSLAGMGKFFKIPTVPRSQSSPWELQVRSVPQISHQSPIQFPIPIPFCRVRAHLTSCRMNNTVNHIFHLLWCAKIKHARISLIYYPFLLACEAKFFPWSSNPSLNRTKKLCPILMVTTKAAKYQWREIKKFNNSKCSSFPCLGQI